MSSQGLLNIYLKEQWQWFATGGTVDHMLKTTEVLLIEQQKWGCIVHGFMRKELLLPNGVSRAYCCIIDMERKNAVEDKNERCKNIAGKVRCLTRWLSVWCILHLGTWEIKNCIAWYTYKYKDHSTALFPILPMTKPWWYQALLSIGDLYPNGKGTLMRSWI